MKVLYNFAILKLSSTSDISKLEDLLDNYESQLIIYSPVLNQAVIDYRPSILDEMLPNILQFGVTSFVDGKKTEIYEQITYDLKKAMQIE